MSKSQETYSKKDKEKIRLKKRQDKLLKKEERKANSKGGGLEEMMAYVDEYGNIVDTPIDPKTRTKVDASTIDITVPKRDDEEVDVRRKGRVQFFNSSKGYGFIKDLASGDNVFVHINGILEPIADNDMVSFEMERGKKGMNAVSVRKEK